MISGFVEKIVYRNSDNAYCVFEVSSQGDDYVLTGTFPYIEEGDFIEADGEFKFHPVYGEQFVVKSYAIKQPENAASIEKYLSSGAIKGVGPGLARKIVNKFGDDAMRILEEEPERLAEIKGISDRMAMEISAQVEDKKEMRDAMMFLTKYGISMNLGLKIYKEYGEALYSIIETNPYQLADDVTGIGFRIADEIARKVGFAVDSEYRIKAAILYCLMLAGEDGHMYLPYEELENRVSEVLGNNQPISELIKTLEFESKIVRKGNNIYSNDAFFTELAIARMLHDINGAVPIEIITGGPGTGKTTNIKKIIEEYESAGLEVALAAPTGRAAKRMQEATGHEASTIHRLIGVTHDQNFDLEPLEYDVVIIDEMSMVDAYLMKALLKCVNVGTKLVLVGDTNQLPSVGPGNVLKDIIASNKFNTLRLTKIYRQAEQGDIILNAHKMIDGENIDISKKSNDFLFVKRSEPDQIISALLTLVKEKLPDYVDADIEDIQVMSPMKKGALGVERLNKILQEYLNPASSEKAEKEINGTIWREGDKVMQIKNNYKLEWEIRDERGYAAQRGEGMYNGDIGIIREVNLFAEEISVEFDDERIATYTFNEMDELEHAFCITIHKSQGSEYPAVVIPVHSGPRMLMTRNLIYTAVTRAQKCVTIVGVPERFVEMTRNTQELKRYSSLQDRLDEVYN